jgi:hypothetical protein
MRTDSERGNALYIILIGIALLAALTFAITKGGRTEGTKNTTREQARLVSAEMVQFGDAARISLDKMIAIGNLSDGSAALLTGAGATAATVFAATGANAGYGTYGTNPSAEVFNPGGGGLNYGPPPNGACAPASPCVYDFTGQITVTGVGTTYGIAMIVLNVDPTVCAQINSNQKTGLATIPTNTQIVTQTRFNGANYGTNGITLIAPLAGLRSFCYLESPGARYIFVHVVRAR